MILHCVKPEETWSDKGRYPPIKSEIRGDVVYGWSLNKTGVYLQKNQYLEKSGKYLEVSGKF